MISDVMAMETVVVAWEFRFNRLTIDQELKMCTSDKLEKRGMEVQETAGRNDSRTLYIIMLQILYNCLHNRASMAQ